MRRVSVTRLRDVERRAPRSFGQITLIHTVVDVNPMLGGPPIVAGVFGRSITYPSGPTISEVFDPEIPEAELPPPPNPAEIAEFQRIYLAGSKCSVVLWRNSPDGPLILLRGSGQPDVRIPLLPAVRAVIDAPPCPDH